jgi:hypothetical protein
MISSFVLAAGRALGPGGATGGVEETVDACVVEEQDVAAMRSAWNDVSVVATWSLTLRMESRRSRFAFILA